MITSPIDGTTRSLREWSEISGVSPSLISFRLARSIPFDKALTPSRLPSVDKSPRVSFNGETRSLREWARHLRIPYARVYSRFMKGLPVDSVLATGRLPRLGTQPTVRLTLGGRTMSVREWARELGIKPNTIYQRIVRRGGNLASKDILSTTPLSKADPSTWAKRYTAHGKTQTITEWTKELGCSRGILYRRMKDGLPPDEVFTEASSGRILKYYTLDGVTMPLKGWAEKLGLTMYAMRRRLQVYNGDLARVLSPRKKGGKPRKSPPPPPKNTRP